MINFRFWSSGLDQLKQAIQQELENNKHTPDRALLGRKDTALVFEYGDMRDEFNRNRIFQGVPFTPAWTIQKFYMWTKLLGKNTFPIASTFQGLNMPKERVQGELYAIPSDQLIHIDNYRQNGVQFRRKKTRLVLPSGTTIEAHAYIGTDYWNNQFQWDMDFYRGNGGSAFSRASVREDLKRPHLSRYYDFNKEDCREPSSARCFLFTKGSPFEKDIECTKASSSERSNAPSANRREETQERITLPYTLTDIDFVSADTATSTAAA